MRLLLTPRAHPAYGQDFIQASSELALRLVRVSPNFGNNFSIPSTATLLAAHDLTYDCVARCFHTAPPWIPRVAHLHLQWGFCPPEVQDRIGGALTRTQLAITPAGFLHSEMEARFPEVHWVPVRNGVDSARFRPSLKFERANFRRSLNLPSTAWLWAFIGRLEEAKGLAVLRSIVPWLRESDSHLLLQFPAFGSPIQNSKNARIASTLHALDPARVHLWPDTEPGKTDRPIRFCDLLLHPSLSEVAPLTWIESWMSGVPILATRSTPFCDEVHGLDIQLIDLPTGTSWSTIPQPQLRLDRAVADGLAEDLAGRAQAIPIPSDHARKRLAIGARAQGFADESMLAVTSAAYSALDP
jgi:glycosyltransferase involved in cell wall biosynthesis